MDIMLKWQFMGMTAYDAILFIDHDTDFFPYETDPDLLRARWQAMLPLFLRPRHQLRVDSVESRASAMRLLVCTDGSSPVNTGLMLFKPSRCSVSGIRPSRSPTCRVKASAWPEYACG